MVMLIILLFVFPLALLINSIVENSEPLMPGQISGATDTAGALLARLNPHGYRAEIVCQLDNLLGRQRRQRDDG